MAADSQDHTVVIHVTPGEILDERWRIETRIGQGAMGSVFKGKDLRLNKPVAIKILAPEHCRKPKVLARFEREAEKMTTLRHPNIVLLHGHGRRGALPYIVMEYLEGLSLADALQKAGGTIGLHETVAVVKQIAAGLAFLHSNGLVHRDVKPQNIIIGTGGRVTILDLGVVRDQANPGLTRPGAMVGTPYYMSPEQILGAEDIDLRTDVYALGAMTFELLTGRPPFLGANNFEVLYGHKNLPAPDASQLVKAVPKSVGQVLARALSKNRYERQDSVTELATDLEAAAGPRKADLAKAFDFIRPEKEKDEKPRTTGKIVAEEKTRIIARPAPRRPTSEVPMADSLDVISVENQVGDATEAGAPPQTQRITRDETPRQEHHIAGESSSDLKTVLLNIGTDLPAQVRDTIERLKPVTEPEPVPEDQAPKTGQLRVIVTARGRAATANITIDGTTRSVAPRSFTLPAGRHLVRIELPGFRSVERTADVVAGTTTNVRVVLERA